MGNVMTISYDFSTNKNVKIMFHDTTVIYKVVSSKVISVPFLTTCHYKYGLY